MTTRLAVMRTGSALAITAVLLNVVCAALIALWPAESISFTNAWMHGVDLQLIRATAPPTLGGFFYGLIALASWLASSTRGSTTRCIGSVVQTRSPNEGLTEREGRVALASDRRRRNAAADCGFSTCFASIGAI